MKSNQDNKIYKTEQYQNKYTGLTENKEENKSEDMEKCEEITSIQLEKIDITRNLKDYNVNNVSMEVLTEEIN